MKQDNSKTALRRALDQFKTRSPVEQAAVRAYEEHFDALAAGLQNGSANLQAMAITKGFERAVAAINAAISRELDLQREMETNSEIAQAAAAAQASSGAAGTFLRRDQCSHGNADAEGEALYQKMLTLMHKMGDILMAKPRGTYANLEGSLVWVSPLKLTPGADVFIYSLGDEQPELDGNGTYPLAYFDELGVGEEVVETIASIQQWLNNPVFGQMVPDYLLDQIASFSDCCRYSEVTTSVADGA